MISRIRRFFLAAGVCGWGIALLGVLLPWRVIEPMLLNMGMRQPVGDPQIQYWFRMATGGWSIIGFFFLAALLKPEKYAALIPLLAIASLFEGAILLTHGSLLGLPMLPFAGDVSFCLVVGAGLLLSSPNRFNPKR